MSFDIFDKDLKIKVWFGSEPREVIRKTKRSPSFDNGCISCTTDDTNQTDDQDNSQTYDFGNLAELISSDIPNRLKLGSDDKLLSIEEDVDYLAYYKLYKG